MIPWMILIYFLLVTAYPIRLDSDRPINQLFCQKSDLQRQAQCPLLADGGNGMGMLHEELVIG